VLKYLGVLGGMGPLAAADFLRKVAENTCANCDQEHVPVLLYGDCSTPDRTEGIVGSGPSPLPQLLDGIRFLNKADVRAICIPCNSAHYWFPQIQSASRVPVLHIALESIAQIKEKKPGARVVGVMSTYGTFLTGVYNRLLLDIGYTVLTSSAEEFKSLVSPGIAMVKSNCIAEAERLFSSASSSLLERGAEIIILACTEIPLGMQSQIRDNPNLFVDSTDALAKSAVNLFKKI